MKFWIFTGSGISPRLAEACFRRRNGQMEIALGLPIDPEHEYADYYRSHSALNSALEAKELIKARYAGLSVDGTSNIRGVEGIKTSDVYLYPAGMNAIWNVHRMLRDVREDEGSLKTFMAAHVKLVLGFSTMNWLTMIMWRSVLGLLHSS